MQGQINLEYYQNNNCFSDIKSAIEQLMTASEAQFESIKREKWYNRLWNMITFSKKKDIRLAEQISTLSKAQQLFMEILVRISQKDVKVAELIRNNSENIKKLSENNIYLLTHVNRLERICLGITTVNDPAILSVEESKLLSAFIYILSGKNNDPSNFQKNYLNNLLDHIKSEGITTDANKVYVQIEEGSEQLKEITLRCAYEYLILSDKKLDISEEEQEIIDQLDIGKKTTQRIISEISMVLHSRGCEGIANKYYDEPFEEILPFFDLGIEETEENIIENKNSTDDEEVSEENIQKAIQLALDYEVYSHESMICLKDYIFISTETTNILISSKDGNKDEIDWLPHNIMLYDYISYKNKVCCTSSIGNLLIDFDKKEFKEIFLREKLETINPLVAMNDKYIVATIFKDGQNFIMLYNILEEDSVIMNVENARGLYSAKIINDDILLHIYDTVYKYNTITMQTEKLFTINDEYTLKLLGFSFSTDYEFLDSIIRNNRLYILSKKKNTRGSVKKGHIYSFDISSPKYGKFENDIYFYQLDCVHSPNILKIGNGWLFVSEENQSVYSNRKYTIKMFNCENKNIIELANNCGGKSKYTDSINIGKMNKWGDYVFFDYYEQNKGSINACVSIKEPMNIIFSKNK